VHTYLATGVWATSPMDSDSLRNVQLLLKLLHNSHGSVLGLDDCDSTKLGTRAGHKASRQISGVDLEPAEPQSLMQKLRVGQKKNRKDSQLSAST